jgi:GAF domain-containing protein/ligand-binding sensor domain-containing protein
VLALLTMAVLLAAACGGGRAPISHDLTVPSSQLIAEVEPSSIGVSPSYAAGAPGRPIDFKRLTLEDGLSQSSINCIAQDVQGFMWFGTQDGLNRYDGYEFKVYKHDSEDPNSLSDNYVMGCKRDQRDVMWILTRDGTLHRYEPEIGRFIRYRLALEDPFQQMGSEFTTLHGDARGRLWIGTYGDGLVRYNPEEDGFTYYQHDPDDPTSLSHRVVWKVYEDREGVIWVGTEGGLNRYDEELESFVRYPYRDFPPGGYQYDPPVHDYDPAFQPDNPRALGSPVVTDLLEDREGQLWVGTRYGGFNRLDRETGQFVSYPYDPAFDPKDPNTFSGNSVRSLLEDGSGHIWVSSVHWNVDETRTYARLGLERFDPQTDRVIRIPSGPDEDAGPCSLSHHAVRLIYEDKRGTLWFHTFAGGLDVYDRTSECFEHYSHDPDDPASLSGDGVTRFYEDEAGGLWIGTDVSGVNLYDPGWAKFPAYRVSAAGSEYLSNNSIWRFAVSPETLDAQGRAQALWVSTFAGINYWDRQANSFTFYEIDPQLPDTMAYGIFEDAERDTVWLATTMGLERAALPADRSVAPEVLDFTRVLTRSSSAVGYVPDLYPAGPGQLWLARYGVGLQRFDLETEEIVSTYRHDPEDGRSLGDDRVMDIFPGQDGTLWLATRSGIEHFDPAAGTFARYLHNPEDPQGVPERVYALYDGGAGEIWIGTSGDGLRRFDPAAGVVTMAYEEKDGLPNNVVYSILPDEGGQLWITTNNGLVRFDPGTETFQTYTSQDGLQSNEFNWGAHFRAPDGELFFGGVNGINVFYPQEIASNLYVPPVVITEILLGPPKPPRGAMTSGGAASEAGAGTVLEAPPSSTEPIELSYQDRILSFEFAALHYAIPERNEYAYLMEGFDEAWNYVGNRRFATYTNLPPGRYTFRVTGSNSDGVWNQEGTSVVVTVSPPFWITWWFRSLVGLALAGGAVAAYRLRVRDIEARSRELERQVADRTEELAAVNAIAGVVSRSLDLKKVLADALDKTLEVMGIEAGGIYLLEEETGTLNIVAQRGFSPEFAAGIDGLRIGEGFSGRVAQSGKALIVRDVSGDPRLTREVVEEEGLHSLVVVPLGAKGKVLGTLFTVMRDYREFTERDVQLLTSIGHQIGVAVENAALYAGTRGRLAQLTALQETTTAVAGTLELEKLLGLIVRHAVSLLHAEGGILNMVDWDAGEDQVVAAVGVAVDTLGIRSRLEDGLSGWVTLHNEALVSNDVRADERIRGSGSAWLESKRGKEVQNTAIAPLAIKDRVVGTLVILDKQGGARNFDQSDLNLLQAFANQAALAIENARLFDAEQRRAEQFRVISQVGRHTTSILSIDQLLCEIVLLIQDSFDYDIVEIGLVEGEELVFKAGVDQGTEAPFQSFRVRIGRQGVTGWVGETGEPLLIPDVSQDERFIQFSSSGIETRSELAVPIKTKEKVVGVLNVQSAEYDAFDESDLVVMQALADQAATAIENARLFEAEQRRAEQFRVISEMGRHITSILTVDELLQEIVRLIRETFGYYLVTVGLIEEEEIVFKAGEKTGWSEAQFLPPSLKVGGRGITAWVAATGEPILAPDVTREPQYLVTPDSSETQSELAVPLRTKTGVIGALNVESDQLNAFDESDMKMLESLATQAAIAIENARLYEQARRLAVVEERQRLARELHDSVTQGLYGVTLYAEATARQLTSGSIGLATDHLRELRDTAQEALREMRLLIFELRPSVLESEGLVNALRARLEAVEERAGLAVEFEVEGETILPSSVEEGLYRIAQEALNNALKHAGACNISVCLKSVGERVILEIVDDGTGFDPSTAVEAGGLGLDGMLERAAQMGGELMLNSEPGAGTRVRVEVPE